MKSPILFTTAQEIAEIRRNIQNHGWYKTAYENLQKQVDTLLQKGAVVPTESGFVFYDCCERDNHKLVFDPYTQYLMYCPQCGMRYTDMPHRRAWVLHQHNWLSQMALLAGIVYQIEQDEKYARLLHGILMEYARVYPGFPNNDNELGPTLFAQSTYMESVFILYMAAAYDMVRQSPLFTPENHAQLERSFFRPSVEAILDYDEQRNNRQAFNNAGILAVGYLLQDSTLVDYALNGPHGFYFHMENSVLSDGMWYEGDNYHFATLPSLVNIAEICLRNGLDLYHRSYNGCHGEVSLEDMFLAPLKSLQPDLTFPSRKDSPYANFFAQRWYTGLYELAYTRYSNPALSTALNKAYAASAGGNMASAAGVMDVFAPAPASRSDMDFRGFLLASPHLPEDNSAFMNSRLLDGTGLAVLKRTDNIYFSVDYGDYGGGHGHPDRLNINYFYGGKRWFSDFGTGSYYFDHLRYYRSSVSHNVIITDGKNHQEKSGSCHHFFDNGSISLLHCTVNNVAPGVNYSRTNLLVNGLLLDIASAVSSCPHTYHLALHPVASLEYGGPCTPATLEGDGYDFLEDVRQLPAGGTVHLTAESQGSALQISSAGSSACYLARAYGPPSDIPAKYPVILLEQQGCCAEFVSCFNAAGPAAASITLPQKGMACIAAEGTEYTLHSVQGADGGPGWILDIRQPDGTLARHLFNAHNPVEHSALPCTIHENLAARWLSAPEESPVQDHAFAVASGLRLEFYNPAEQPACIHALGQEITIPPQGSEICNLPLTFLEKNAHKNTIEYQYTLDTGNGPLPRIWKKAFVAIPTVAKTLPVDAFPFQPNLFIRKPEQIRRNEKHYNGPQDLSLEAMLADNGESLILRAKVQDDVVLFSGGKFPYDNDSLQIHIDMRSAADYDSHKSTDGVVSLLLVPPANGEQTRVLPTGKTKINTDLITASMCETATGYEALVVIAWEALGGRPQANTLFGLDILLNDRDSGVRRDLQGVWSGCAEQERAYLKQASHETTRFGVACLCPPPEEGIV